MVKFKEKESLIGLGIMSGTSLDGFDFALSKYNNVNDDYDFELLESSFFEMPEQMKSKLENARSLPAEEFLKLENSYTNYLAKIAKDFFKDLQFQADFLAVSGQTIYHQPENRFSYQMLNGGLLNAKLQIPVVCDFRRSDIALDGQGAPLVPIGDQLLFSNYDSLLNLGGFANISFQHNGLRIGFDIAPCNRIINSIAKREGLKFDTDGELARSGKIHQNLLNELNEIEYPSVVNNTSLGEEFIQLKLNPILKKYEKVASQDLLCTYYFHLKDLLAKAIPPGTVLITGGGAHNSFLMELIEQVPGLQIAKVSKEIIDYKEAIIFGFLGFLRLRNEVNVLSSVTGSIRSHIAGAVYG